MTFDNERNFLEKLVKDERKYRESQRQHLIDTCKTFILVWPGRKIKSEKNKPVYPMGVVTGMGVA